MAEAKEQCKEWGDECVLFEKEADMLQAFLDPKMTVILLLVGTVKVMIFLYGK